jgi:hypothetical protein
VLHARGQAQHQVLLIVASEVISCLDNKQNTLPLVLNCPVLQVYRSSTVEEREALLKCEPTLLDTLRSQLKQLLDTPKGPAAAAHCIGNGSSALKAGGDQGNGNGSSSIGGSLTMPLQPLECVWEVEPPQVAAMAQVRDSWAWVPRCLYLLLCCVRHVRIPITQSS